MIDFKNGERLVYYSNVCGLMVYRYMIKRLGLTGNGNRWMALLQRRLLGEKGTGANPNDRAKSGTKRSLLVDGKGDELLEEYGYTIHIRLRGEEEEVAERYQNTEPDDGLLKEHIHG